MLLKRANQNSRELALRKYFAGLPTKQTDTIPLLMIAAGALLLLVGIMVFFSLRESGSGGCSVLMILPGLVIGLVGYSQRSSINSRYEHALKEVLPQPTDQQVDEWYEESLRKLIAHSRQFLRLTESEGQFSSPLLISAPTLASTHGIPSDDLKWRRGSDGRLRFAVQNIVAVYLTERHLAAYTCDFNFIRDVALNETTREYHYQDIVSVATYEWSESFAEPTEQKLTTTQHFRLSVASGECIEVRVDTKLLRKMTQQEDVPAMGAEQAVATIRAMLRDKKA